MHFGPCSGVHADGSCEMAPVPCPFPELVRWPDADAATNTASPTMAAPFVLTDFSAVPFDRADLAATARSLTGSCDAVLVGEHQNRPDYPPTELGRLLLDTGTTPWITLACRDRNRIVLEQELRGLAAIGVPTSGAADRGQAALAHRLVGNRPDAALLETVLGGLELRSDDPVWCAVTGPATAVTVDGRPVGTHRRVLLPPDVPLVVAAPPRGLRHYVAVRGGLVPPPVLGSRSTYYRSNRPGISDVQFTVMNLCGWINGNLVVERQTRADRRVVLGYHDLLDDWRTCLARVRDTFGLTFDDDLQPGHHHRVDDFIDPGLRRHGASWEGWDVPQDLVEIAQEVFDQMTRLAGAGGHDATAEAALDAVGERYAGVMRDAEAIAHDAIRSFSKSMTAKAMAAHDARLAETTAELEQARARVRALEGQAGQSTWSRAYRGARRRLRARREARHGG